MRPRLRACPLIRRVLSWSYQSIIRPLSSSFPVCCHGPRPPFPDNGSRGRFQKWCNKWFMSGLEVTHTHTQVPRERKRVAIISVCVHVYTHNLTYPHLPPPRAPALFLKAACQCTRHVDVRVLPRAPRILKSPMTTHTCS